MTTMTEILPLEGVDLLGDVPCTFRCPYPKICRAPSVARVITACVSCELRIIDFACASCRNLTVSGMAACGICLVRSGGSRIMQARYQGDI